MLLLKIPLLTKRDYTECYEWRANVLKDLEKERYDIILMTGVHYEGTVKEKYEMSVIKIQSLTKKLIILEDTPYPNKEIPECLVENKVSIEKCQFRYSPAEATKKIKEERESVLVKYNVQYVKVLDLFCANKICPPIIDGMLIYYDNSHITPIYAEYLANILEQRLNLSN